jgi:16S rRNA G1207 methylase RsmC
LSDEFVEEPEDEYDLIVSNPHFIQNYKTVNGVVSEAGRI